VEREFQRWTARRKVELLLQLIKGEATLFDVCRECVAALARRPAGATMRWSMGRTLNCAHPER
jgi:hypothetical protein